MGPGLILCGASMTTFPSCRSHPMNFDQQLAKAKKRVCRYSWRIEDYTHALWPIILFLCYFLTKGKTGASFRHVYKIVLVEVRYNI